MRKNILFWVICTIITVGYPQGQQLPPGRIVLKAKQTDQFCQYRLWFKNQVPHSIKLNYLVKSLRNSGGNISQLNQGGNGVCPPKDSLLLAENQVNWLPGDSLILDILVENEGKTVLEEKKILFNKSE